MSSRCWRGYPPANTPTSDVLVIDEVVGVDVRPATAGEALGEQSPVAGQRLERLLGRRAADRVVEQIDAGAFGRLAQRGANGPSPMITVASAPRLAAEVGLRLVAHDGDDASAERLAELHGGDAAAPGGAEHGEPVALADLPRSTSPIHPVMCGIQNPAADGVVERLGHRERRAGVGQAVLGERPVALDEPADRHHPVPTGVSTPSPTADTTPAISCPGVNGRGGVSG